MSDEENQLPVDKSEKDAVEQALDRLKPLAAQIGVGGIMGYCTGMAMKKVGKVLATVLGLGFVAVQSAAYAGYIQVNWKQIGDDAIVKRIDSVSSVHSCSLYVYFFGIGIEISYCWWNGKVVKVVSRDQRNVI